MKVKCAPILYPVEGERNVWGVMALNMADLWGVRDKTARGHTHPGNLLSGGETNVFFVRVRGGRMPIKQ